MSFVLLQAQKPSLHNMNGLFRIIITLDAGTSKLMDGDVVKLMAGYLVDASLVRTFSNFRALTLYLGDLIHFFHYFALTNLQENRKA